MCGIFFILSKKGCFSKETTQIVLDNFNKLSSRGPDKYSLTILSLPNNMVCIIGFQRLAINDVSEKGMQPFYLNNTYTICNGEIYNYHDLTLKHNQFKPISKSDCEILPFLFNNYPFEDVLNSLDAVFALSYFDFNNNKIYLARDRIGVKPLFYSENENYFAFASEVKALDGLFNHTDHTDHTDHNIIQLQPSSYMIYSLENFEKTYHIYTHLKYETFENFYSYDETSQKLKNLLVKSVQKRLSSDRDIGCLLSGGLDSSLIASILSRELSKEGKLLHTFSIGFPDSTDIVYARQVASHIGSIHHEYIIQYHDALTELENVVKTTETYDTTTIRASTPMYMLCKWINKNFPHKVIFSGEGSDELLCGYLYFHKAPNPIEAHTDSVRLIKELYKYDVLRADRCTAGNGLEFREPFLDKDLIDFVLSINPSFKVPRKGYEKELLRNAFSQENYLPDSVLWRRKAAFSDAVSSSQKPWYKWIHEYIENNSLNINDYGGTPESNYYKTLFYKNFKNYNLDLPLWLPRWTDVGNEPSATVLDIFNKEEH
jgi:asparagine synthase (glutamine-hydrolysing)